MPKTNYGDLAENEISRIFTRDGATCNAPSKDRNGWDFIIEYGIERGAGVPLDRSRPIRTFQAQVKSTIAEKPSSKFKLSNGHKYASSELPVFVFLAHFNSGNDNPTLYGKHIWESEILNILRAVRTLEVAGNTETHKKNISISFGEEDKIEGNCVAWVEKQLSPLGDDYSARKKEIFSSVGYSRTRGEGTLIFPSSVGQEDIVNHELGLIENLPIETFKHFDIRFGVRSAAPIESFQGGTIAIRSQETARAVMKCTCGQDSKRINLPADIFIATVLGRSRSPLKTRVLASCFEIVFDHVELNYKFRLNLSDRQEYKISELFDFCRLVRYSGGQSVQFRVSTKNGNLSGQFAIKPKKAGDFFTETFGLFQLLNDSTIIREAYSSGVSVASILTFIRNLWPVAQMIGAGSLRLKSLLDTKHIEVNHFCGYFYGSLGDKFVAAIVQWDVKATSLDSDGSHCWFMLSAHVVDTFVLEGGPDRAHDQIQQEFQDHVATVGAPTLYLGDGNLISALKVMEAGGELMFCTNVD